MTTIQRVLVAVLILAAVLMTAAWAENSGMSSNNTSSQGSNVKSNASTGTTASSVSGAKVTIGVTAKNIAFNTSTITVPANANVTIAFNNQDSGVPHNIAVYKTSSMKDVIYKGEIFNGVKTVNYNFKAPSTPGTYYFQCDVHPSMNGKFVVT